LKDSRSSYAIEGERAPHDRIDRWGRAIGEAGRQAIDLDELLRLQRIVIGDARFVRLGLRTEDGFVGEHDRETRMPLPGHIDARADDLPALIEGMTAFDRGVAPHLDAVVAAAVLAFGFVYVHPFEDGNGRIHRYLIHHVLAQRGFSPPGLVFPVSSAILEQIDDYRRVLEDYGRRLLPCIDWEPTERGNGTIRRISIASSTQRPMPNFSTAACVGRSSRICRRRPPSCTPMTHSVRVSVPSLTCRRTRWICCFVSCGKMAGGCPVAPGRGNSQHSRTQKPRRSKHSMTRPSASSDHACSARSGRPGKVRLAASACALALATGCASCAVPFVAALSSRMAAFADHQPEGGVNSGGAARGRRPDRYPRSGSAHCPDTAAGFR
jgi:hypothetical protein